MRIFLFFLIIFSSEQFIAQTIEYGQTTLFDFSKIEAQLNILPEKQMVEGKVYYYFEVLSDTDTLMIDGRNMQFKDVMLNGAPVDFYRDDKGIFLLSSFKKSKKNIISLVYSVKPESGMYFINWDIPENEDLNRQVWTQGQGKYTSTWFPSFDDMQEKAEFDLKIDFPEDYKVVSNGVLLRKTDINDSITRWEFDMQKPMSSYLLAIAAGNFKSESRITSTGHELEFFFQPEDSLKVEPTYRYSAEIMDFLENEIGVPYPWQNYKQIPVEDFLYAGMENTGTTIFSNALMVDSIGFNDRNYINVNAHELAHQWFGNLVTETTGKHHWLQEGFATYYALLTEKEIFGEDYYYWKLYETAETLRELSDTGKGESLLDPKASSLTFYQKGAWALHILREKLGDEAFRTGIFNYLKKYSYRNVETGDFISEMEKASGMDLQLFSENWLQQSAFKSYAALESLRRSEFIVNYLNIAALKEIPLEEKSEILSDALSFPVNDYIGQEVVYQLAGLESKTAIELYRKAFETNNLYIRQAIARSMEQIPAVLKQQYESLLEDESYLTKETALFKLWEQFPSDRKTYFEKTQGIDGFYNKNIRMLWLTLNLVTPEIDPDKTQEYYNELSGYTNVSNPFQVRENAFSYLYQLGAFNDSSLKSLVLGSQHHTYRFRDFCRKLLQELINNSEYREKLSELAEVMQPEETTYLRSKLNG